MKKVCSLGLIFTLLSSTVLVGCGNVASTTPKNGNVQQTDESEAGQKDRQEVESVVEEFGRKLQNVSLLAPEEALIESIEQNYGELLSPSLLDKWVNNPELALGRKVSSPWPDRIEIVDIQKSSDKNYDVNGEVIEVTSAEQESGESANKVPISLKVIKVDDQWKIDEAMEKEEQVDAIVYTNREYGFAFSLPKSWEGYEIVAKEWEGNALEDQADNGNVEKGPMILIRHPDWKEDHPRQDIPIMVLTLDQWDALQQEKFHIGAAPIPPKELGRNDNYVFALPARYNFEFPPGYEEVEEILENEALQPIQSS